MTNCNETLNPIVAQRAIIAIQNFTDPQVDEMRDECYSAIVSHMEGTRALNGACLQFLGECGPYYGAFMVTEGSVIGSKRVPRVFLATRERGVWSFHRLR